MMDVLMKILMVVCVCYSAVDARPGSRDLRRSHPYGGSDAHDSLENELMGCAVKMQIACTPILLELFPDGPGMDPIVAAEQLKERGIKHACRIALQLEQCAMNTLNTECSDTARQTILAMARQQITAARNALRYTCVQHIEDFDEVEKCMNQFEQQGVEIDSIVVDRCPDIVSVIADNEFCGIDEPLRCSLGVFKSYCGEKGADVVQGLVSGLLRDIGCGNAYGSGNGIQRAVKLLRRAFS